jgi:hypothetical protein
VKKLYKEINLNDMVIQVNKDGFTNSLLNLVNLINENYSFYLENTKSKVKEQKELYINYHNKIERWLLAK